MVPQAQGLDACNPSDLQDNKPLTAKWMKRMDYLSRTQRLMGYKCSSMGFKVAQRVIAMLLEPIYEQDFLPCSYGFRPGRSAHDALHALRTAFMTQGLRWVLDIDIVKYLDRASYCPPAYEGCSKRSG